jgi:hypothetical protein
MVCCLNLAANVFAVGVRQGFETAVYRNAYNKAKCFFVFAKQKLINCLTDFANTETECLADAKCVLAVVFIFVYF